jgi:trimethylamine---corrinoid protein Co-methyltransferase
MEKGKSQPLVTKMAVNQKESMQQSMKSGIANHLAQRVMVLGKTDLDAIHSATLQVLQTVGVEIEHPEMLSLLKASGAEVEGSLVLFPENLIEWGIQSAPPKVTLHARNPQKNVYLGEGRVHFTNGFGATWVEDSETHQVRDATLLDLAEFTRLADALDRVDYCLFSVVPQDIPPKLLDIECTAVVVSNTEKHIQLSLETAEWLDDVIQIGEVIVGKGNPLPFSAGGVPNSPLKYPWGTVEKYIRLARREVPCFVVCGAMAGATSPVTLAGTLVQQNAEVLAGILMTQLANSGAPVIYGTFSGGFDMRVAKLAMGGPEATLLTAASQQLCEMYQIPLGYGTGGVSDSELLDIQTGMEKTSSVLFSALACVDVIHDASSGLFGAGMVTSQAGMVIDNDLCNSIAYLLHGIPADKNHLAQEVIAEVRPGGSFFDNIHTAKNLRQNLAILPLRNRNAAKPERVTGPSEYVERARQQAKKILQAHNPSPLTSEQIELITQIMDEAKAKR